MKRVRATIIIAEYESLDPEQVENTNAFLERVRDNIIELLEDEEHQVEVISIELEP